MGRAIVYGEDLSDTLKDLSKNAVAQFISSIIKMGIQWVVTEALKTTATNKTTLATSAQAATVVTASAVSTGAQVSALAATTAASTAAAGTTTAAWAPAATVASIGSFGGAAAIGLAAVIAAIAMSRGGFEEGGYTGNMGRSEVAGVVHGREFVMDAATTSRIGVANLESLRSGAARVQKADYMFGAGQAQNQNETSSQTNNTQQNNTQNLRIVNVLDAEIVNDFLQSSEGEQVILNTISNNSETVASVVANA